MSTTPKLPAKVPNPRDDTREVEAAKRRHPAGSKAIPAKLPAKTTPANATAKQLPAPGASAEKERQAPRKSGAVKLRWRPVGNDDRRTGKVTATVGDTTYELKPSKSGWQATVKSGDKTTVIITDVGRNRAYYAATDHHHWGKMPQTANSVAKAAPKAAS
jgi:hypothetical protein